MVVHLIFERCVRDWSHERRRREATGLSGAHGRKDGRGAREAAGAKAEWRNGPTLENSKCVKKKCENLEHFFSIYYLQGERPGQQSDLNTLCNIL